MSTTGRPDTDTTAGHELAEQLRGAEFVRLVAARTGDAVAAAGLLADALGASGTPHQSSVVGLPASTDSDTEADVTVALGRPSSDAETTVGTATGSVAQTAYATARQFEAGDPLLALAGTITSGHTADSELLGAAEQHASPRPGLASPGVDPVDTLAHSTLVHAAFSGDRESAEATVAELGLSNTLDEAARQRLASHVTLTVAGDDATTRRGALAVEQFLRPRVGGRFETVGGFADVLEATAREQPGLAMLLALGGGDPEAALSCWREHGQRSHQCLRAASTGRYNGLFVAQCEDTAPVGTVARLLCAYRSPEPVVLAVSEGIAEARTTAETAQTDVGAAVRDAATRVDGAGGGTAVRGRATYDVTPTEFIAAFREAV